VAGKPLSDKEQKIFDLVVGRFVAAFHGPHVYAKTEAWLRAAEYDLYASARQTVTPGWRAYYPPGWKPLAETSPAVMTAKKGDVLPLDRADLNEGKTSPPPRFTEASLLSMMKSAWRYAEAPDIREALKDAQGIGTEATRAAIIEVLKNRKYVEIKGKSFWVTDLGMAIANAAKKMGLVASDIGFTGMWEKKLGGIARGASSYESFVGEVKTLVAEEIEKIRAGASSLSKAVGGSSAGDLKCPSCESAMRVNRGGAFCSDEKGCGVKIWRKHFGKELTDNQLKQIVQKGKTFVKGFTSKAGKSFDGWLVFDNKYGARLDFSLPPPKSTTAKKAGGAGAAPVNKVYAARGRRSPS
jgi:DNA topoisomerase-3